MSDNENQYQFRLDGWSLYLLLGFLTYCVLYTLCNSIARLL